MGRPGWWFRGRGSRHCTAAAALLGAAACIGLEAAAQARVQQRLQHQLPSGALGGAVERRGARALQQGLRGRRRRQGPGGAGRQAVSGRPSPRALKTCHTPTGHTLPLAAQESAARSTGGTVPPPTLPHPVHVAVLAPQRAVQLVVWVPKRVGQRHGVGPQRPHQRALLLAQPGHLAACGPIGGRSARASRGVSAGRAACGWPPSGTEPAGGGTRGACPSRPRRSSGATHRCSSHAPAGRPPPRPAPPRRAGTPGGAARPRWARSASAAPPPPRRSRQSFGAGRRPRAPVVGALCKVGEGEGEVSCRRGQAREEANAPAASCPAADASCRG